MPPVLSTPEWPGGYELLCFSSPVTLDRTHRATGLVFPLVIPVLQAVTVQLRPFSSVAL